MSPEGFRVPGVGQTITARGLGIVRLPTWAFAELGGGQRLQLVLPHLLMWSGSFSVCLWEELCSKAGSKAWELKTVVLTTPNCRFSGSVGWWLQEENHYVPPPWTYPLLLFLLISDRKILDSFAKLLRMQQQAPLVAQMVKKITCDMGGPGSVLGCEESLEKDMI